MLPPRRQLFAAGIVAAALMQGCAAQADAVADFYRDKSIDLSIGFGPGDEKFAHTSLEQVSLDEVVAATEFYALFPKMLSTQAEK